MGEQAGALATQRAEPVGCTADNTTPAIPGESTEQSAQQSGKRCRWPVAGGRWRWRFVFSERSALTRVEEVLNTSPHHNPGPRCVRRREEVPTTLDLRSV